MLMRRCSLLLLIGTFTLLCGLVPQTHAADEKQTEFIKLPSNLFVLKNAEATKLGKEAAEADFAAGHYRILSYGLMAVPTDAEKNLEKRGIHFEDIAGCVVSEGILGFAHGYNSTMQPLLKKKFGPDIFKGTKADRQ